MPQLRWPIYRDKNQKKREAALFPVRGTRYFEQAFYLGVTDKEEAGVVEVVEGSELTDLNIVAGRLLRYFSVGGLVNDAETGKPVRDCHIELGHKTLSGGYHSSYSINGLSDTDKDGKFKLSGLIAGSFFVNAHFSDDAGLYAERIEFEVKD